MADAIRQESPLVEVKVAPLPAPGEVAAGVVISERPFLGHLNLRGNADEGGFQDAVAGVLGTPLPKIPNTMAASQSVGVAWLGPDEWLVLSRAQDLEQLRRALLEAVADYFATVTDVSSGQTVIAVSGARAADLLSRGCPLDLHPRAFLPGHCAQSHIAKSAALICKPDEQPAFEVVVRRSFADYLFRWLTDAAAVLT